MENQVEKTVVERIVELCKERDVPISKLEKDLHFGNGSLNPKKTKDIKTGRFFEILKYLGVSTEEFFNIGSIELQKAESALVRLKAINPELYDYIMSSDADWDTLKNPALFFEDGSNGKIEQFLSMFPDLSEQEISVLASTATALIAARKSQDGE